jgi:hypothetical protein
VEVGHKFILNSIQFLQDQLPSLPPLRIMGEVPPAVEKIAKVSQIPTGGLL